MCGCGSKKFGSHCQDVKQIPGPTGPAGADGVDGVDGADAGPFENFYAEVDSKLQLAADPAWVDNTYFQPAGYTGLKFTNASGASKDYIVHFNYDYDNDTTETTPRAWVDAALVSIKTGPVEANEWIHDGNNDWKAFMFDGVLVGDVVNLALGDPYETRYITPKISFNTNMMKKITLLDTESIEARFKSKAGSNGNLVKAQMFVQEL